MMMAPNDTFNMASVLVENVGDVLAAHGFQQPLGLGLGENRVARLDDDEELVVAARDPIFSETKTKGLLETVGGKHITDVFDQH